MSEKYDKLDSKLIRKDILYLSHLANSSQGSGLYDREIIEKIRDINDPYPYFRGLIPEITKDINLCLFTNL